MRTPPLGQSILWLSVSYFCFYGFLGRAYAFSDWLIRKLGGPADD